MAGEAGAIGPGSLDTDDVYLAEAAQSGEQAPIAAERRLERLDSEERAVVVQGRGDVGVEVCVDTSGDPQWQGGHCHPFVG